tara:strand:+ start:410 stop:694 length:285 start_codon:yes stop_codon:yes gene_type:complete
MRNTNYDNWLTAPWEAAHEASDRAESAWEALRGEIMDKLEECEDEAPTQKDGIEAWEKFEETILFDHVGRFYSSDEWERDCYHEAVKDFKLALP